MNIRALTQHRDKAYAKISDIYADVREGRWDNTHTVGQLRAAVAMHEAACRELDQHEARGDWHSQEEPIMKAVDFLRDACDERPTLAPQIRVIVEQLAGILQEGGPLT